MERVYYCIDLKTFYASVECVERGLDPFLTNLVVADSTRGSGSICLAVSPAMKMLGVKNRCRVFEIPKNISYIMAKPRMNLYIKYSAEIYAIYLKFIAKEDIHVYSIDEAFLDATSYLKLYKLSKYQLAKKIIEQIKKETGVCATCGIGSNLYLAKIALDIEAKHNQDNIGYLNEELYQQKYWKHRPLTDFWQIGKGIEKRLQTHGYYYLEDIAKGDEKELYRLFGINAEYLIDHAWGREPCTIKQIKNYRPTNKSISSGQVLFEDYSYQDAMLVVKEMVELLCLEMTDKKLVGSSISISVGYSKDEYKMTGGSLKLDFCSNSFRLVLPYFLKIYQQTTMMRIPIRKINVSFGDVQPEIFSQYGLFIDQNEVDKDVKLQKTIVNIKEKYGKNSILRGMNLEKKATTIKRNKLIGGHNSE